MTLPPKSKRSFSKCQDKQQQLTGGCPSISNETKEAILAFLECLDMSHCFLGEKDTVYCGKDDNCVHTYKIKNDFYYGQFEKLLNNLTNIMHYK